MADLFALTQYHHLVLYCILLFGIMVMPGPDMVFVMGSTLAGGRKQGGAALAGIVTGGRFHDLMAYLGIGFVLMSIPGAFPAILLVGACYMVWIGWQMFQGASALTNVTATRQKPARTTFIQGVMTCLLNPKAYLFMLAIYPQFVRPEYGSIGAQVVLLGLIGMVTQTVVYAPVWLGTDWLMRAFKQNAALQIRLGQAMGVLLILAALWSISKAIYAL